MWHTLIIHMIKSCVYQDKIKYMVPAHWCIKQKDSLPIGITDHDSANKRNAKLALQITTPLTKIIKGSTKNTHTHTHTHTAYLGLVQQQKPEGTIIKTEHPKQSVSRVEDGGMNNNAVMDCKRKREKENRGLLRYYSWDGSTPIYSFSNWSIFISFQCIHFISFHFISVYNNIKGAKQPAMEKRHWPWTREKRLPLG